MTAGVRIIEAALMTAGFVKKVAQKQPSSK